jgi:hypothetical protein
MNLELTMQIAEAQVISANRRTLLLQFPEGERVAKLALCYPYEASPGDAVLTVTQDDACYVIGVLEGKGLSKLNVPGDLELKGRRIRITARESLELQGERVRVKAGVLETAADSVIEKCKNAWRWVREALSLKAGSARTAIDEDYVLKAGRIDESAKKDVRIDGQKINLG